MSDPDENDPAPFDDAPFDPDAEAAGILLTGGSGDPDETPLSLEDAVPPEPPRADSREGELVAAACARLTPRERELLERVLARGGRTTLDELGVDPAIVARMERVVGWFGVERGGPRSGPLARVAIQPGVRDAVASCVAGVPSLRRRPLAAAGDAPPSGARERARAAGPAVERLLDALVARGGVAPLVALPVDVRSCALLRDDPLETARLGRVGRLDLRERGLALDAPVAVLHPAVLREVAAAAGPPGSAPRLGGALLAVDPVLALARTGELVETREGLLAVRTRERLAPLLAAVPARLHSDADAPEHLVRALVAAGLLARAGGGALVPGRAAPEWRRASPREKVLLVLRGAGSAWASPGAATPPRLEPLVEAVRRAVLELDGPVPLELPARLGMLRWLDAPAPDREGSSGGPGELDLDDAGAIAWAHVVPPAEALGLVVVEGRALRPTALLEGVRASEGAPPSTVVSADGEALVLPGPGALAAALHLARAAQLAPGSGEVLRFRIAAEPIRAAQALGEDLDRWLAELAPLVRGPVPPSVERIVRDASAGSVHARARTLHVLEIPRVAAADRAARILGPLVIDRLTPTLLALAQPLGAAQRRALAREGVFVDDAP